MLFDNSIFDRQTVDLDGNTYKNCTFTNCHLRFSGNGSVTLMGGAIDPSCQFVLNGPAEVTLKFLAALYGAGLQTQVESILNGIRKNAFPVS